MYGELSRGHEHAHALRQSGHKSSWKRRLKGIENKGEEAPVEQDRKGVKYT